MAAGLRFPRPRNGRKLRDRPVLLQARAKFCRVSDAQIGVQSLTCTTGGQRFMRSGGFVTRQKPYLILLALGLGVRLAFGAWTDQSAGLPPVEIITAKTMGSETALHTIAQDGFGRFFVGSNRLLVYDG